MKLITTILFLVQFIFLYSQHPSVDPNYYLFWEDNFDDLDFTTNWDPNVLDNVPGFGEWKDIKNPFIYNRDYIVTNRLENVYVDPLEGILHQVVRKEEIVHDGNDYHYTASTLQSIEEFETDMYIEASIKLPVHFQDPKYFVINAAFWMYKGGPCDTSTWWGYREIDIMEFQGNAPQVSNPLLFGSSTGNLHYCHWDTCYTPTDPVKCRGVSLYQYDIPNQSQWHTYAAYWSKNKVSHFLDNNRIHTYKTETPNNKWDPMTRDMNMINGANLIRNEVKNNDYNNSIFPYEYLTDYIRVWKLINDFCDIAVYDIPDFNSYEYGLKESIILTDATQVPQYNPSQVISLMAVEFIEFTDGFEVLDNREISFNTNDCPDN